MWSGDVWTPDGPTRFRFGRPPTQWCYPGNITVCLWTVGFQLFVRSTESLHVASITRLCWTADSYWSIGPSMVTNAASQACHSAWYHLSRQLRAWYITCSVTRGNTVIREYIFLASIVEEEPNVELPLCFIELGDIYCTRWIFGANRGGWLVLNAAGRNWKYRRRQSGWKLPGESIY